MLMTVSGLTIALWLSPSPAGEMAPVDTSSAAPVQVSPAAEAPSSAETSTASGSPAEAAQTSAPGDEAPTPSSQSEGELPAAATPAAATPAAATPPVATSPAAIETLPTAVATPAVQTAAPAAAPAQAPASEQPVETIATVKITHVHRYPIDDELPLGYVEEPATQGPRIRGYGGISMRATTIKRNPSVLIGARGGLILGERFSIGGAFYDLTARMGGPLVNQRGEKLGFRAAWGGLTTKWSLWRRKIADLGLETLVGAGAACVSRDPGYGRKWRCIESVRMFVVEPGLNIDIKLLNWLRLGIDGGYRFVARNGWRPPNNYNLSGPYVGVNVDIGWFAE